MAAMLAEIKSRMLLPRVAAAEGQEEDDPRAELVRRLQEYERFKKAAEDIDQLTRLERDTLPAGAELAERKVVKVLPQVTLQEMLVAFKEVLSRSEMFAHHHVARERLSVRQRMSDILSSLNEAAFVDFAMLFRPQEGRMGVTVTFIAILELMKEGLIEIVQGEAYAPIHVRTASGARKLTVVEGGVAAADAENEAALAQPAIPDENEVDDEEELEVDINDGDESESAVTDTVTAVASRVQDGEDAPGSDPEPSESTQVTEAEPPARDDPPDTSER
jgi:segregation and condensation protein A